MALPQGAVRQDDGSVLYTLQYPCIIKFRRQSDGATREESLRLSKLRFDKGVSGYLEVLVAENGQVMEFDEKGGRLTKDKVPTDRARSKRSVS